jgi:hypothetical protein
MNVVTNEDDLENILRISSTQIAKLLKFVMETIWRIFQEWVHNLNWQIAPVLNGEKLEHVSRISRIWTDNLLQFEMETF